MSVTPHSTDQAAIRQILTRGVAEVLPTMETLAKLMAERPITVYLGIDPTGSLLHLGHSVALRKLQQFAELGHRVILLIGNGTVRIGDPTGRDSSRPTLTDAEIEANFQTWQAQASKILNFDMIEIVHNGDWLDKLTFADLVKLMAKTTVQQLIERDMFQERLKKGLPIFGHEIMYPLLQGYDSVAMDVDLEIGGTDQTFNMMMGRELQQAYNQHEKWVLSTPIINGTDGRKMSKSFGNYVALNENPTDMYGKLMRISDDVIVEYFTLLTNVSNDEIKAISQSIIAGENPMQFKKRLAHTITADLHSAELADKAAEHFQSTIQDKTMPAEVKTVVVPNLSLTALQLVKAGVPELSNSEIRRLLSQKAVSLVPEGTVLTDSADILTLTAGQVVKVGKRTYFAITNQ
jgi:tyrosyl-tRNA synthetase